MNGKIKTALFIVGIVWIAVLYTIVGYELGYNAGFEACIEETNSYHLYNN